MLIALLEYLWLEFNAYKNATDKRIAELERALQNVDEKNSIRTQELNEMLKSSLPEPKENPYTSDAYKGI